MSEADEGMPTWVKVVGAITLLLICTFVVVALTGAGPGDHGPGRHAVIENADGLGDNAHALTGCWTQSFEHGSSSGVDLAWAVHASCST